MAIGNNNGRAWLDKWMWEIVRLTVVGLIALAGAYWAVYIGVNRANTETASVHTRLLQTVKMQCREVDAVRSNQSIELLTLLTVVDVFDDRWKAGLRKMPPSVRRQILVAISNLPDRQVC